jgi:hypothetical protein
MVDRPLWVLGHRTLERASARLWGVAASSSPQRGDQTVEDTVKLQVDPFRLDRP